MFYYNSIEVLFFLVKTFNPKFIVVQLQQYCFYNNDRDLLTKTTWLLLRFLLRRETITRKLKKI